MADSQLEMATKQECQAALMALARRLDQVDDSLKRRHAVNRTVTCYLPDLDATFSARLHCGTLLDLGERKIPNAQVRLTMCSDDLLAMTEGRLTLASAWSSGRLRIEASVLDMLRLRAIL